MAFYGFPADLASQFQYPPKACHRGAPGIRVTICSSPDLDTLKLTFLQAPMLNFPRESSAPWEGGGTHVDWFLWSLKGPVGMLSKTRDGLKQKAGSGRQPSLPRGSHPKGPGKEDVLGYLALEREETDGH